MRTRKLLGTAFALLVLTLAGCADGGSSDQSAIPSDAQTDVADDGTTVEDDGSGDVADPSADTSSGVEIPDDIPLPDEHEIVEAIGNPDAGYTILLQTPMPVDEVADLYETELPAAGWESLEQRQAGPGAVMIDAYRAGGDDSIAVQINPEGDESSVNIFTGPPGG